MIRERILANISICPHGGSQVLEVPIHNGRQLSEILNNTLEMSDTKKMFYLGKEKLHGSCFSAIVGMLPGHAQNLYSKVQDLVPTLPFSTASSTASSKQA